MLPGLFSVWNMKAVAVYVPKLLKNVLPLTRKLLAMAQLIFGETLPARVCGVQTVGGSGALRYAPRVIPQMTCADSHEDTRVRRALPPSVHEYSSSERERNEAKGKYFVGLGKCCGE